VGRNSTRPANPVADRNGPTTQWYQRFWPDSTLQPNDTNVFRPENPTSQWYQRL
jgi:hypothetical protein